MRRFGFLLPSQFCESGFCRATHSSPKSLCRAQSSAENRGAPPKPRKAGGLGRGRAQVRGRRRRSRTSCTAAGGARQATAAEGESAAPRKAQRRPALRPSNATPPATCSKEWNRHSQNTCSRVFAAAAFAGAERWARPVSGGRGGASTAGRGWRPGCIRPGEGGGGDAHHGVGEPRTQPREGQKPGTEGRVWPRFISVGRPGGAGGAAPPAGSAGPPSGERETEVRAAPRWGCGNGPPSEGESYGTRLASGTTSVRLPGLYAAFWRAPMRPARTSVCCCYGRNCARVETSAARDARARMAVTNQARDTGTATGGAEARRARS